jgi:hypothetical protein
MKRLTAWRTVIVLLVIAWLSFAVQVLIAAHYNSYPPYRPSGPMQVVIGIWVYAWWGCHIAVALIILYKVANWIGRRMGLSKA